MKPACIKLYPTTEEVLGLTVPAPTDGAVTTFVGNAFLTDVGGTTPGTYPSSTAFKNLANQNRQLSPGKYEPVINIYFFRALHSTENADKGKPPAVGTFCDVPPTDRRRYTLVVSDDGSNVSTIPHEMGHIFSLNLHVEKVEDIEDGLNNYNFLYVTDNRNLKQMLMYGLVGKEQNLLTMPHAKAIRNALDNAGQKNLIYVQRD